MRELRSEFNSKGVDYTQIHKDTKLVIYQCCSHYNDIDDIYYEVFRYKIGGMNPMAADYDPNEKVESYPKDNSFGVWAWCCSNWKCVYNILKLRFGYTDEYIVNLVSLNAKLAQLGDVVGNMPPIR